MSNKVQVRMISEIEACSLYLTYDADENGNENACISVHDGGSIQTLAFRQRALRLAFSDGAGVVSLKSEDGNGMLMIKPSMALCYSNGSVYPIAEEALVKAIHAADFHSGDLDRNVSVQDDAGESVFNFTQVKKNTFAVYFALFPSGISGSQEEIPLRSLNTLLSGGTLTLGETDFNVGHSSIHAVLTSRKSPTHVFLPFGRIAKALSPR